jgi:hypothetical protein
MGRLRRRGRDHLTTVHDRTDGRVVAIAWDRACWKWAPAADTRRRAAHWPTCDYAERSSRLAQQARDNLRRTGRDGNVQVVAADGSAVMRKRRLTMRSRWRQARRKFPVRWWGNLNDPGILVIPVGAMDDQELRVLTMRGGYVDYRVPTLCRFVPLRGGEGWR